jgi:hypothetical protein
MWLSHDMHDGALAGLSVENGNAETLASTSASPGAKSLRRIGNQRAQGPTRSNKSSTQNIVSKMSGMVRNSTILNDICVRFSGNIGAE